MIPIDVLTGFAAAVALLGLAPGPDNLFVLTQSAMNGARAGLLVVLGLCTGLIVHSCAVALGLVALLQASSWAFNAIKLAGALYLIYLALGAWRAPISDVGTAQPLPALALYRRGVIMNLTNPKVAIFFLAFFTQFIDPSRGAPPLQIVQLGAIFILVTLIVFGGIALLSGGLSKRMRETPVIQRVMNRIAAVVFVGLAANILLSG